MRLLTQMSSLFPCSNKCILHLSTLDAIHSSVPLPITRRRYKLITWQKLCQIEICLPVLKAANNLSLIVKITEIYSGLNTAVLDLQVGISPLCKVLEMSFEPSSCLKQFKLGFTTFLQSSLIQSLLVPDPGPRDLRVFMQSGAPVKRVSVWECHCG